MPIDSAMLAIGLMLQNGKYRIVLGLFGWFF